jgi:hypothetical protein
MARACSVIPGSRTSPPILTLPPGSARATIVRLDAERPGAIGRSAGPPCDSRSRRADARRLIAGSRTSLRAAVIFYRRDGSTFTDPLEYAAMLADESYRRVALTHVGAVEISTVFLGFDHGFGMSPHPILFETMVFGGPLDTHAERWTNEVAALAGHDQWVERVRELEAIGERRARDAGQASDSPE